MEPIRTKPPTREISRRPRGTRRLAALAAAALLAVASPAVAGQDATYGEDPYYGGASDDAPVGYDAGYSYVRNLRGSATLLEAGGETERAELVLNQPLLAGDRLWVAPGSRVEVLLSDGNLLRIDGDSEVVFERLAMSPESGDRTTEIRLAEGNVQLVVFADALGDGAPRVQLPNATVYLEEAGSYRLTAERDWAQVVAREGWAEVATARGSTVVRAGEEAIVEGARAPRSFVRQAGARDDLERWGERLDDQQLRGEELARYEVDDSLRYAAAPLEEHGTWVTVEHRRAWRPYVDHGWRPYRHGRWRHTPIGLTWVSYEPWGWVPYHYGTWDFHSAYGWVWYPGARFAPAWVYWYWGPSHVAWVPAGYYTHYYSPWYRRGFRSGVYGWAGGHYGIFADWVFCPTVYLGSRHQHRHAWAGRDWRGRDRRDVVPRGIITTDTRGLRPEVWRDPGEVERVLRTRPRTAGGGPLGNDRTVAGRGGELPDVTPFVERRGELPGDVERRVLVADRDGRRVAGTPLAPGTPSAARARPVDRPADGARTLGERRGVGDPSDASAPAGGRAVVGRPGSGAPDLGARPGTTEGPADRSPATVRGDRAGRSRPTIERSAPAAEPTSGPSGRVVGARPDSGARPDPTVRPAAPERVRPRVGTPDRGSGGGPAPGRAAPRRVEPERSSPRASGGDAPRAVGPRAVVGRPSGSPATPEAYRSSPRFRGDRPTATATPAAPPRGVTGQRSAPSRPAGADRPPTAAPRGDRGSISAAPPARRVVRGIRGASPERAAPPVRTAPSSPRSAPPRATAPSRAPERRPATRSAPSGRSGGSRAAAPSRSSGKSGGGKASSGSGRSGGGRAARVRGKKDDGDNG